MNEAPGIIFGLAAAAAFALISTGIWLLRQPGGNRLKSILMMVAGVVILFNGWINSLPPPPKPASAPAPAPAAATPSAR